MIKKIVKKRKPKFTKVRRPYKQYQYADWEWSDIFKEIDLLKTTVKKGYFLFISDKYGILYKTLVNKYYMYINNKDMFIPIINEENRGGCNKIFTYNDEEDIFLYVKTNFMDMNKALCNDTIKIYSTNLCKLLYPDKIFTASDGWCTDFKKRWNLSTVRCTISKISTCIHTQADINIFLENCIKSCKDVGDSYFFNLDETKWYNINASSTTIHIKGTGSAKININGNDKEGFTLKLIINRAGLLLPPIVIAKGRTNICLRKYDIPDNIIGTYSNNGWTNYGIMIIALDQISKVTNGRDSVLVLDKYPAHVGTVIEEYAALKKIKLIYIPTGLTYKFQPLDVLINGILKQKSKYLWRQEVTMNPNLKITNKDAIRHLNTVCKRLHKNTITKSFNISCLNRDYIL